MITFGFIIEIYIQGRALVLETLLIAATARLRIENFVYLSVYLFIYPSVNPSIPRNQNQIKSRSLVRLKTGPQRFWGSGENVYLFSGSWGTLVIIFRDLRSKLIVFGIKGALQKCKKKSHLKRKAFISFVFFFLKKSSASGGNGRRALLLFKYMCVF